MNRALKILLLLPVLVFAENRHPIILLHGFIGWGRDEMKGYYYWGGKTDLEQYLRDEGFEVYTVSVGPISSNWDRAVETFYQIKGGQVDYGIAHSKEYGLIRKPPVKNYPGLYPEWDADHPVHIIAHSMGGQTARMLEILLKETFHGEESHLLSGSHQGWIKSITTLSSPHDGTTLAPVLMDLFPFIQKTVVWLAGMQEGGSIESFYDFDLEQWGLERQDEESLSDYMRRLRESPLKSTHNFCAWDLSPEGAKQLNSRYRSDSQVYYFSYASYATKQKEGSPYHYPDDRMSWRFWSLALLMGRFMDVDSTWYENDGVVNTVSMWGPSTGEKGAEPLKDFDGVPVPGVWQKMEKLHMDHGTVIGHMANEDDKPFIKEIYRKQCELLYSLD